MTWTQPSLYHIEHSKTGARVAKCYSADPRPRYLAYSPEINGRRTLLGVFDSAAEAKARCEAAPVPQSLTAAHSADEAKALWARCEQSILPTTSGDV